MADVTSTFAAKDVGFTSTVNRMQRSLVGFQNGISSFAARAAGLAAAFIGVQQSIAAFRSGLEMAGRLNDLSKTTGEAAGNLAMLERAFQNNGMAAEQVGVSLAKMSEFIVNLRSGSESASKAADAMGISLADLAGKSPVQQMQALMQAIAEINDPALRTATAVDVFGRAGRAVVPLASQFASEMSNARAELGSLIPILNESGASLDELGDKLSNSVGNKFTELAIGFAAGITGANDFVTALSRIDAAGFGKGIGDSLRIAFDAPLETAKAIGYTLLTGVKQAGNNLMNAFSTAISFFRKLFSDGEYWSGIGQRVQAMFMESVNAFNKLLLGAVEGALLKPLSNLPGILGDPFRAALETTNEIRASLEAASETNAQNLAEGGQKVQEAIERAAASTDVIAKDWFGVEKSAADAAKYFKDAEQVSQSIRDNSKFVAENLSTASTGLAKALDALRGFDAEGNIAGFADKPYPENTKGGGADMTGVKFDQQQGSGKGSSGSGSIVSRSDVPATQNERIAELRGQARAQPFEQRAQDLADRGMYRSAVRNLIRGEKRMNDAMDKARLKDYLGGATMQDAYNEYRKGKRIGDRMSFKDYEKAVRKDALTPSDLQTQDDQQRARGGSGSPQDANSGKLDTIIKLMEERLPIRVLAA